MKIEKKYLEIPFDCIKDLVIEPCLKFNSEGLFIKSFAESNAALCLFQLPKEKFIEYSCEKEERFKISADLFFKIMKRIKTKNIILDIKDEKLIISDENKKEYAMAIMYDDEVERDKPELELKTNFKIKSIDLQNLFLDAGVVSDDIKIQAKENKLTCITGNLHKFNQELECEIQGDATSNYALEYLNTFMNATKYFKDVLFEFDSDKPCKLTFKDELEIQFILAARCE